MPDLPPDESAALRRIFGVLRNTSGVDFKHYKAGTINRRIRRRMVVCKCDKIEHYVRHLESNPAEAEALFQDIVIHVTGFFREPESFQALKDVVFPKIAANLPTAEPIRIWVPGCSSGEEVYSIAIALLEYLGDRASQTRIQIFGTDISPRDIETARAGIYPETSTVGISPERLVRFFVKVDGGCQIRKPIREMCVFARHDLAKDPPFSRLDLISCRNVLIYLGPVLQKRVVAAFHWALKPTGMLLLGKSESISSYPHLFAEEGRNPRLYVRKPAAVQPLLEAGAVDLDNFGRRPGRPQEGDAPFNVRAEGERLVLDRYAPPGFFVDASLHIVHIQGDTSPYLKPTPGEPSFHLLKMVRPELVLEIRTALHQAKKDDAPVRRTDIRLDNNGESGTVDISVIPLPEAEKKATNFLVLFEKRRQPDKKVAPAELPQGQRRSRDAKEIEHLKLELGSTQVHLRSMIEDGEASSEELQAANEEILSSNEELQSTNEELETAKEELQSSNEELTTLNEELQNRNTELAQLANDLSNLLIGVEIPIVIVSADRRIRRFTPSAEKVFNLIPGDVGRPIGNIKPDIEIPDLEDLAAEVLNKIQTLEREVRDKTGHWYSLRMRPYKTAENKIDGVIIALADIDALKRNLNQATESKTLAEAEREEALESLRLSEGALRRSREQLRSLARKLLAGEEERTRRVSQQLQEDFNQRVVAVSLDLSKLNGEIQSAPGRKKLQHARDQLWTLSNDIGQAAKRLHPTAVGMLSLASILQAECRSFSRKEGMPAKVSQRNVPDSVPREVGLCLYRIVQESLSNVARHSKADKVSVNLSGHPGSLRLSVKDNGVGFEPAAVSEGLGLVMIHERTRMANGKVAINSRPGKGTEVIVEVPLTGPEGNRGESSKTGVAAGSDQE